MFKYHFVSECFDRDVVIGVMDKEISKCFVHEPTDGILYCLLSKAIPYGLRFRDHYLKLLSYQSLRFLSSILLRNNVRTRSFCRYLLNALSFMTVQGGPKRTGPFLKVYITFSYNDIGRRSIYQNVQLFIRSKNDILNVTIFKYSLRTFGETILHRKYQLI